MTSRADELAEAVEAWAREQLKPSTYGQQKLFDALRRYRNSAPSEETHERVRILMRVNCLGDYFCVESGRQWVNGTAQHGDQIVTAWLPKPAPVPEIDDVEVELG